MAARIFRRDRRGSGGGGGAGGGGEDLDRVVGWMDEGRLVDPGDPLPTIVDLIRATFELAGRRGSAVTDAARELVERIGPARHIVFVLIDGLGVELLRRVAPRGFLSDHAAGRVRTVFPSTTAAAMTSLVTGAYPAEHGITGWWVYLAGRGLTATVLPFVERFSDRDLREMGIEASDVFVFPPMLPGVDRPVLTVTPRPYLDDAFLLYTTGGTPAAGYETPAEAFDLAARHIRTASPRPTYTSIYLPQVDSACHSLGVEAPEVAAHLGAIEAALKVFRGSLGDDVRIIVTGDHGHVSLRPERALWLEDGDPFLDGLVCPPSGEPTVPYLHLREGVAASSVRAEFRERYGEAFALLSREEASLLRLYGPSSPSGVTRSRTGDLIGIAPEPTALYFRRPGEKVDVHRGVHAGLTPGEMMVPVIVA